jgi:hypothetical protein
MFRSLKQVGTRRGTLAGTRGQKGGMFGESIGLVDNVPSDTPLGGNRQCTEQVLFETRTCVPNYLASLQVNRYIDF